MSNQSDTPETDAFPRMKTPPGKLPCGTPVSVSGGIDEWVPLEDARKLERQRDEAIGTLEYIAHAGLSGRHLEDIAREFLGEYRPTIKRPMQSHSPACQLADKYQCDEPEMEMSRQDIEDARGDYEYQLMIDRQAEDE